MLRFWKKYHKWVGLVLTFFVLMFCFSGIVLNHRRLFSSCNVSRAWLPQSYHYENWNNGFVKGTRLVAPNTVLLYGNAGVWTTDTTLSRLTPLNDGLPAGADNRKVSNVVHTAQGQIYCAALYGVYRLDGRTWTELPVPLDGERVSDVTLRADTLVVLSRSHVFTATAPYATFTRHELNTPADYNPQVSLFKTVWQLHSGEIFGLTGRLVVDAMALVIIWLCISGLVWFFFPGIMKRRRKSHADTRSLSRTLTFSAKWHNRLGRSTVILTLLLALTGACLRPPLMIPLAMTTTRPVPLSTLSSDNAFHDKLRAIRWDSRLNSWLLSTSMGFYSLSDFSATPVSLKGAPAVSPMGINVFEPAADGLWLVGSFSGLCAWDPSEGICVDYFTGRRPEMGGMRSFGGGGAMATGFSSHLKHRNITFDYSRGAIETLDENQASPLPPMPAEAVSQPMSLWNFALELHVGRCYSPLIGPLSSLFVFLSGTLLFFLLLSGWIVVRRTRRKHSPSDN